jgi:hypothetical protein
LWAGVRLPRVTLAEPVRMRLDMVVVDCDKLQVVGAYINDSEWRGNSTLNYRISKSESNVGQKSFMVMPLSVSTLWFHTETSSIWCRCTRHLVSFQLYSFVSIRVGPPINFGLWTGYVRVFIRANANDYCAGACLCACAASH